MREHQPKCVDTITLIALVLMLLSGAMAVQRFLTAEQPGWHRMFNSRRVANNLVGRPQNVGRYDASGEEPAN
jgi:hypothetical protein